MGESGASTLVDSSSCGGNSGGAQAYVDGLAAAFNAASMAQAQQAVEHSLALSSQQQAAAAAVGSPIMLQMPGIVTASGAAGSFGSDASHLQPPSPAGSPAGPLSSPPQAAAGGLIAAVGGVAAPGAAAPVVPGVVQLGFALPATPASMQASDAAAAPMPAAAAAAAADAAADPAVVAADPTALQAAAPAAPPAAGEVAPAPGLAFDLDTAAAAAAAAATAAAAAPATPSLGSAAAAAALPAATVVLPAAAVQVPLAAPAVAGLQAGTLAQPPAQHATLLPVSPVSADAATAAAAAAAAAAAMPAAAMPGAAAAVLAAPAAPQSAAAAMTAAGLNAPLLMAAGLSTATALMPTGATPAQLATGMPAVQAVPVIVTSQQAMGTAPTTLSHQAQDMSAGGGGGLAPTTLTAQALASAGLGVPTSSSPASLLGSTLAGGSVGIGSVGSLLSSAQPLISTGGGTGGPAGGSSSTAGGMPTASLLPASAASAAAAAAGSSPGAADLVGTLTQLAVAQQQQVAAAQQVQAQQAAVAALVSSGNMDMTSPALGCSLQKLAAAQQQQQQAAATAATLQAAAASAAAVAGSITPSPSAGALLPGTSLASNLSNLSLSNLRSASVASSMLSGPPTSSTLEPIPSIAGSTSSSSRKVRVLLSSGGEYEELAPSSEGSGNRSVRWRYVGGETRLVGIHITNGFSAFLQQLSKATSAVWDESCRLMYDLPSACGQDGLLVDLIDDEDLEMMWEELEAAAAVNAAYKLHLYVQLGCRRSSGGPAPSSIASEEHSSSELHSASTPKASSAVAAATAAAAAVGSSSSASAGGHTDDDGSSGSGRHQAAGGGGGAASAAAAPGNKDTGAGGAGGAAGGAAAGAGAGGAAQGSSSDVTVTSTELEDLAEDIVSDQPALNLSDLESRMEIIRPEDLQPVRLLGSGGFGEVYLCRWHSCEVAVKCLNPNLLVPDGGMGSVSGDSVSELLKEASILGGLRHPNVTWVYGLVLPPLDAAMEAVRSGLQPGQGIDAVKVATQMANRHRSEITVSAIRPPALVTEFLASGSLRAAITRKADFVVKDSVRIKLALDAARGMDYLHSKHIVHFDLKTANLLVGMRDKVPICKVADFGLSKQKQQTFVTGVATLRGTLPWIAPEIIKTPSSVTEAVDVYSFGIVLWELWTLREPFEGINYHALLHMMSSSSEAVRPAMPGSPDFEGEAGSEPSPGWKDLINSCLQAAPEKRPTFRDLVGALEGMLRQNRLAKKRSASGPAAPGVEPTPATSSMG